MEKAADLIIEQPVFDDAGFLEWTDEVEAVFQRGQDLKGQVAALARVSDTTFLTAVLIGLVRQGVSRRWIIRIAVIPNDDDSVKYAIIYQYPGEQVEEPSGARKMYPKLPIEERVTGTLAGISFIKGPLDAYFEVIDSAAEDAHREASTGARASLRAMIDDLHKPKPWWQFW